MTSDTWQLVLIDVLFLCIAGGWGMWMRSWMKAEREEIARCLEDLKSQQDQFEQVSRRLQSACLLLEAKAGRDARGEETREESGEPQAGELEDRYDRAWKLLAQGQAAGEVARRLQLGVAEVELMGRILRHKQRS